MNDHDHDDPYWQNAVCAFVLLLTLIVRRSTLVVRVRVKHKDLKMYGHKLGNMIIFTHLKLWVAVARHNFKWVKIL